MIFRVAILIALSVLLLSQGSNLQAQSDIMDVCPTSGIILRGSDFVPGGIILTAFDAESLWVYDIDRNTRYPLPDTRPCTTNCHLSPDMRWLVYMNPQTYTFSQMRLDGTERQNILGGVADVMWWNAETWMVWTPDHRIYLQPQESGTGRTREFLPSAGVLSLQPAGYWALALRYDGQQFVQVITDLSRQDDAQTFTTLTADTPYFNNASWSPHGEYLAYVGRGAQDASINLAGSELFLIRPGDAIPRQLTFLSNTYGAVRINGYAPTHLSWSPDGQKIAFWVTELLGSDVEANTGNAVIHILDINTGDIRRYCAFGTGEHTPNPSRLAWAPDNTHLAFAGNIPGDDKGFLLLALRLEDGLITELSDGIYPALGNPDVVAWGYAD